MTESPFPFGAVEDAPYEDEPAQDSKRNLIALGALAVVALAGGAFLFLGGGDDLEEDVAFTPAPRAAAPPAEAPVQAITLPVANADQLGRNPFKALYVAPPPPPPETQAPVEGGAADDPADEPTGGGSGGGSPGTSIPVGGSPGTSTPGTSTPGTSTPGTSTPGTSAPGGGVPGSNPGGGGTPAPPPPAPPTNQEFELVLLSVSGEYGDRSALFTVGGTQMNPKIGETFGPTGEIKLLSVQEGPKPDQWTAVLQVGDGDPFDVVTGDPVFVR